MVSRYFSDIPARALSIYTEPDTVLQELEDHEQGGCSSTTVGITCRAGLAILSVESRPGLRAITGVKTRASSRASRWVSVALVDAALPPTIPAGSPDKKVLVTDTSVRASVSAEGVSAEDANFVACANGTQASVPTATW